MSLLKKLSNAALLSSLLSLSFCPVIVEESPPEDMYDEQEGGGEGGGAGGGAGGGGGSGGGDASA